MPVLLTTMGLVLSLFRPGPSVEVVLWSIAYGVDPHLALAVEYAESGTPPESMRDRLISKTHDYGRFQIHCPSARNPDCSTLLDRHVNIRTGVAVVAAVQARFAVGASGVCRCGRAGHHWIAHYNTGSAMTAAGERYAQRVVWKMRRDRVAFAERRW